MISKRNRFWRASTVALAATSLVLGACGGGGGGGDGDGGGGSGAAIVTATSYLGFPTTPGGALPPVFTNEALLITFDRSLDATNFGGFFSQSGTMPQTFVATSSTSPSGIEYHAYANQALARQSVQVFDDAAASQFPSAIIGRAVANPNVLVIDPVTPVGNFAGLPFASGFDPDTQYDVFIPANSGLTTAGTPVASFGAPPMVTVPTFQPSPPPSTIFRTGPGGIPDFVPPQVVEISTLAIDAGMATATTIPADDTIRITFSEPIDATSINRLRNVLIRNTDIVSTGSPQGAIVGGTLTSDPSNTTFFFTPTPSYGPGPFDISITVGGNANSADDILDPPSGTMGAQNSLANTLTATFTTVATPGAAAAVTLGEEFTTNAQEDTGFTHVYNEAPWNPNGIERLTGLPIVGSAVPGGGGLGNPNNGAPRTQITITPNGVPSMVSTSLVLAFSSPFDDDQTNGCANNIIDGTNPTTCNVNPNGGNRMMLGYATRANANELPTTRADSIELYEWAPNQGSANLFAYPGFRMLMGHTQVDMPPLGTSQNQVLELTYNANFDFDNPQNAWIMPASHPIPVPLPNGVTLAPNEAPILVVPPQTYQVGEFNLSGAFIPYPLLDLPFDINPNRQEANNSGTLVNPNLLIDINIPAPVAPSGNLPLGTNVNSPVPARRMRGAPDVNPLAAGFQTDSVIYHGRFTYVKKNSSNRTLFYDLGNPGGFLNYEGLSLIPGIALQPAGTHTTVRIEGADAVAGGMATSGGTGFKTYITRDGMIQPAQLDMLDGKRFFRLEFQFEANTMTNAVPSIDGFLLEYSFVTP